MIKFIRHMLGIPTRAMLAEMSDDELFHRVWQDTMMGRYITPYAAEYDARIAK